MMKNKLKEYSPNNNIKQYIDSYWFFRNNTGATISFPVVPDGCSDIVYYLNRSTKLENLESPFITGVMEFAKLIPIPNRMELFGVRFKPGVLSYLLKIDMSELKNKMCNLSSIDDNLLKSLIIDKNADDESIVGSIDSKLTGLLAENPFRDKYLGFIEELCKNPEIPINDLSLKSGYSLKSLERAFRTRIGLAPKKITRIMRFQKAHKMISKGGLADLVEVALSSGYFDQAHFNREYKIFVGFNPTNETMSIFYNT